ncbi:MAG: ATP-binding protein [Phycisphaeraceae bacterium]|nr:ATP-binding protein [Phycisphaeraceae bacterium]
MMAKTLEQKLVIRSDRSEAADVEEKITELARQAGFRDSAVFAIRLALDEALANAIHHGNREDPAKKVTIQVAIDDEKLVLTVADEGAGFKPCQIPDPTIEENLERPNGRGVMLMRAYMTEVNFNEVGNQVTLIKRRDCDLPTC